MRSIIFVISLLGLIALGYTVFVPNYSCCGRSGANEGASAATLKSAMFASQVQFQAAGYLDIDGNGIGEYGFINHISGAKPIKASDGKVISEAGELSLLTGPLAREVGTGECAQANGYYFKVFLPDGRGGMYDYDAYLRDPDKKRGAQLREKHYIALAWPVKLNETGRRIYAMTEDGQLRTTNLLAVRDAFIEDPDWTHLFKGREGTFEAVLQQGPNDDWPYYSR